MGRKLHISESMVIDTLLTPLSDSLVINANDTIEQWYYVNDGDWLPDRTETPLVLTPVVTACDLDNSQSYTPSFSSVKWYKSTNGSAETEIVSETSTDPFYKSGNNLVVRQNITGSGDSVRIRCEVVYVDPRDLSGVTISQSLELTANRDATAKIPMVKIQNQKFTSFNPLKGGSSQITLTAKATLEGEDVTSSNYFFWYATDDQHQTETLINATTSIQGISTPVFPCYVSGQGTSTLVIDALYTEQINIICRVSSANSTTSLYPTRDYASVGWEIPKIVAITHSRNGGSMNNSSGAKTFGQIVSMNDQEISDSIKSNHLAYKWYRRKSTTVIATDAQNTTQAQEDTTFEGWGQEITFQPDKLRNSREGANLIMPSTVVHADVFLKGAHELVLGRTSTGGTANTPVTTTINGVTELVYSRII